MKPGRWLFGCCAVVHHQVVAETEKTLFCLDEQCVALSRIWCLFEVYSVFACNSWLYLLGA